MTIFDYMNAHPWWTLLFVAVGCHCVEKLARAISGRKR